jgi:hypothetical protein
MPFTPDGKPFDVPVMGSVFFGEGSETDSVGEIPVGGFWDLRIKGRELDETVLRPWLPFMNALISNQSESQIRVQFGDQKHFSLVVNPKRSVPMSDEPFTKVTIINIGETPINKDEVTLTLSNDMATVLRYTEMCSRGLLYPLIWPLEIRRAGDPRRVF